MLHHALLIPHDKSCVLYSARTITDFAYEEELRALARERKIDLWQTVTRENADGAWTGARGRITRETLAPPSRSRRPSVSLRAACAGG
jgi:ferredoxin-NADP reductase